MVIEKQYVEHPFGASSRKVATLAFKELVEVGHFGSIDSNCLAKASRTQSLSKWKQVKKGHSHLTPLEVDKEQRKLAVEKKKELRALLRKHGVAAKGALRLDNQWRVLHMGDHDEEVWRGKLSFIPLAKVGKFGEENQARLHRLQDHLEAIHLRGGFNVIATRRHQKGTSFGMTVCPGGRRPNNPRERHTHFSGTIQLKKFKDAELQSTQEEVIACMTACIEEAFGKNHWYIAAKDAFRNVPQNRRLPSSSLPASNIWWSWNDHESMPHIDTNTTTPCFVLTPYTYHGAELLCGTNELKIPLHTGKVVGGSWNRHPHCNDTLLSGNRYSFVAYFDYRMLGPTYWLK